MDVIRECSKWTSNDNSKLGFKADASMAGSTLLLFRQPRETRQELPMAVFQQQGQLLQSIVRGEKEAHELGVERDGK